MARIISLLCCAVAIGACCAFVPTTHQRLADVTARDGGVIARRTASSSSSLSSSTASDASFTSEGAKRQIGNDAFLNKDLMSRAQNGPGKKNDESLNIGIIGAGLAGMVAAMDLADAGHKVELFEVRPFVGKSGRF